MILSKKNIIILLTCGLLNVHVSARGQQVELTTLLELNLSTHIGELRSVPVSLSKTEKGLLIVYSEDIDVGPGVFYLYNHPLKFIMFDLKGNEIWRKELPITLVPGVWFCPVYPFDLDGDGSDEIYFTNNTHYNQPFATNDYVLEKLNSRTGETLEQYPWKSMHDSRNVSLAYRFRYFVLGGEVSGKPVLITATGTYTQMLLQCWNPDMTLRWELPIPNDNNGARGSHMSPVVDIDDDGIDEIMWGERCINLDSGKYVFIADEKVYSGHSDVIQPVWNQAEKNWYLFTCRETPGFNPRVVLFDSKGERVWTDVESGHMDMGWCANLGPNGESVSMSIKIGSKVAGTDGFVRSNYESFVYETFSGKKIDPPYPVFSTIPVDLNGDGIHELVCAVTHQGDQNIYNNKGDILGNIGEGGIVSMASNFMDLPGEQVMVYYPEGTIKIFADKNAKASKRALKRYASPFYQKNLKLTATGYNIINLGGL